MEDFCTTTCIQICVLAMTMKLNKRLNKCAKTLNDGRSIAILGTGVAQLWPKN